MTITNITNTTIRRITLPLTESALTDWRITYLTAGVDGLQLNETVRAAYATGQDDLPGWTLLKDHEHQIVKMVRADVVQSIERVTSNTE